MFEAYFPIFFLVTIVTLMGVGMLVLSYLIGKKRPTSSKLMPYECGVEPVGDAREKFPVKFYLVALMFIVFDIEVVFLYPWAVIFKQLKLFGLIEMGIFILILMLGYIYILKKGALKWE